MRILVKFVPGFLVTYFIYLNVPNQPTFQAFHRRNAFFDGSIIWEVDTKDEVVLRIDELLVPRPIKSFKLGGFPIRIHDGHELTGEGDNFWNEYE